MINLLSKIRGFSEVVKIGYARISTKYQTVDMQMDALKKIGCEKYLMR